MELLVQSMAATGCFCLPFYQSSKDYIEMEAESKQEGKRFDFEREMAHRRWIVYWVVACSMMGAERVLLELVRMKTARLLFPFARCAVTFWLLSPFTTGINNLLRYIEYVNIDVDINSDFIFGHNPAIVDLLRLIKDSFQKGAFDFILIPVKRKIIGTYNATITYITSVRAIAWIGSFFSMRTRKTPPGKSLKTTPRKRNSTLLEIDKKATEKFKLTSPLSSPISPLETTSSFHQTEEILQLQLKVQLLADKVQEYEDIIISLEKEKELSEEETKRSKTEMLSKTKRELIEERRLRLESEKHHLELKEELQHLAGLEIRCEEQRLEISALTKILGSKAYRAVVSDKREKTMTTNSNKSVLIRSHTCSTTKTIDDSIPDSYPNSLTVFSSTNSELNGHYVRKSNNQSVWMFKESILSYSHADRWIIKTPVTTTTVTPRGHSASVLVNGTWCTCTVYNFSPTSMLRSSSSTLRYRSRSFSSESARP